MRTLLADGVVAEIFDGLGLHITGQAALNADPVVKNKAGADAESTLSSAHVYI